MGRDVITSVDKGGNMAALLLAAAVGGRVFFGFISAVAFATILAVVAGLTLSGAAALSHDLWVNVIKHGKADEGEQRDARPDGRRGPAAQAGRRAHRLLIPFPTPDLDTHLGVDLRPAAGGSPIPNKMVPRPVRAH